MKTRDIWAALLIISLLFAFAACSADQGEPLSGRYLIADIADDPDGVTFDELRGMYIELDLMLSDYFYLEFFDSNRFTLVMFGEEDASGTYTRDGNTLTFAAEEGTATATVIDKKITWAYEGGALLIFEKE